MGLDMYLFRVDKGTDISKQRSIFDCGDEVAYWRKANHIHKWFVDHVQDGEDDCEIHDEVTLDLIRELRDICARILKETRLVKGKVVVHYTIEDGEITPHYEDGKVVNKPSICEELLPRQSGFFFGGDGYDEFYMYDIEMTLDICNTLLKDIDPEKDALYYYSSW